MGVGKSTQISLLYSYFKRNNVSVSRRFIKSFYPSMLRTIAQLGHKTFEKKDGRLVVALNPSVAKRIIKGVLIIDIATVITAYLMIIKLPLYFKQVVLVEEGLLGTITEYMDAAWKSLVDMKFALRLVQLLFLIINKDKPLVIILVTKKETLTERWLKRKSPFETDQYLESQHRVIHSIVKFQEKKIVIYDDENTISEIHNTIVDQMQKHILDSGRTAII